ncbi:MAG TPA: family 43 glycosylhydrolase [Actinopolymorphaceae bacterium]
MNVKSTARRCLAALLGGVLSATIAAAVPAAAAEPAGTKQPLLALDRDFPDPDILKVGDTYYVYATNTGGKNLPVATATSMNGPWTVHEADALPRLGPWARTGRTWAPDVSRRADGKFLLYYTARAVGPDLQCLGAAVADSPLGPFEPVGTEPLVCPVEEGGAIDASSFVDTNGRRFMLYKNDGNAIGKPTTIWLQPVGKGGIGFTGPRSALVSNDDNEGWLVEAPVMVKRGSTYVLAYATGEYWNETYATRYATARKLTGPYTKSERPMLSTAGFDGAVRGPGGADILEEETGDYAVFHGVRDGYRGLYVAELGWANEGEPVVRGMRYRHEAEAGTLSHCRIRTGVTRASGDAVVGYIDYDDSWVELRVYAPREGAYSAIVGFANGSKPDGVEQDATHRVSVNGADIGTITYPFTEWENWQEQRIDLQLDEGWNTLRFTHDTWWTELDYIDIA